MNQVLKNTAFVKLLTGSFLSSMGDQIYDVAVPLLVYDLTRSSLAAGTSTAAEFLPTSIFGLFIGVLLDRWSRKRIMIGGLLLQGLLIATLPLMILHLHLPVFFVYIVSFLMSLLSLGVTNGYEAALPSLVEKEQFVSATAMVSYMISLVRMGGPALAGLLIGIAGYTRAFSVDGLSFILYALLLTGVPIKQPQSRQKSVMQDFVEGFGFVMKDPVLRPLVLGYLLANLGIGAAVPIYMFTMRDTLHLGPGLIGAVFACGSVGGMLGNTLYVRLQNRITVGHQMSYTASTIAIGYLVMGLWVSNWILFCLGYFLVSIGSVWAVANFRYISQLRSPDCLRGRTIGTSTTLTRLAAPVMAIFGGELTQWGGTGFVYLYAVFIMLISMLVSWRSGLWALRNIETASIEIH